MNEDKMNHVFVSFCFLALAILIGYFSLGDIMEKQDKINQQQIEIERYREVWTTAAKFLPQYCNTKNFVVYGPNGLPNFGGDFNK